jgi:homoserine O-acetyltransferase
MRRAFLALIFAFAVLTLPAQEPSKWPAKEGFYTLPNFRFDTGETLPELKLHYLTLGTLHRDAKGHADNAVLLLHGTGGNAYTLLNPVFADVLFGPGQPLDITRYFLILPADIGMGKSSKPSDGLHMRFPQYDYDDMVRSQKMMLDGLHVDHLRLILGTSMGCMQSFVWGETYPGFADALAPFACQAVALAGRNREWRYMAMKAIRSDPAWMGGEYKTEPTLGLSFALDLNLIAGGAPLQLQKNYPTREKVEKYVDDSIARSVASTDANDYLYYVNASRNYDPSAHDLSKITVPVLWINSADDFINPPELGIAQQQVKLMPRGKFILLPITDATRGHGTHTIAAIWKDDLVQLLAESEKR